MAQFTVRVELHGASPADYERLHTLMATYGYAKTLTGVDKTGATGTWKMPTGEYTFDSEANSFGVRDQAKLIADSVKPGAWVLVTQVAGRAWTTAKITA